MPLSARLVEAAKPKTKIYRLYDLHGLYLEISPAGGKSWRIKYYFNNKERRMTIGKFPRVGLADARIKCEEARDQVANDVDPSALKRIEKEARTETLSHTFKSVGNEWMAKMADEWSKTHLKSIKNRMEKRVYPWLGDLPISEIEPPQVLKVVRRIETQGDKVVAQRTLQHCSGIFCHGVQTGRCQSDITSGLKGALRSHKATHYSAPIEPKEVGRILRAIDGFEGAFVVRCALQLAPLFFVRPGELRMARWDQVDMEERLWKYTVTKTSIEHIVPLATQAIEILDELRPLTHHTGFVFGSMLRHKEPIAINTIGEALKRIGISPDELTPHGFRAMARTLLDEVLGYRVDWIEHQLAHLVKDPLGRAYNRTKHLPQRVEMMQAWADYLDELKGRGG